MIKRKNIPTRLLKPGMIIDQTIVDRMGRNLVIKGAELDEYIIDSMLKMGIMSAYIFDGYLPDPDESLITSPEAARQIERLTKSDRSKVKLSEDVKKRVAEGIQYIYSSGVDTQEMSKAATNITDDLMDAIFRNNAVAIDISALKTSDEYTFKHSVDVATIAMITAKSAGLSKEQIYEIGLAGLLHDVGKTKVPENILNKPGRLEDDEFEIMKKHSLFGYRMIENNPDLSSAVKLAVLQHHEKIDGSGYPMAVKGDQISSYAKILSISDIYDALVTDRPYKSAFSQRDAIEMIMSMTGELDIKIMETFLESMILYPVGSIVELSNGEKAKVVSNTPKYILRPTVVGLQSGIAYDLANDMSCANIIIL